MSIRDGDIIAASIGHETDDICDETGKVIRTVTRWTATVTRAHPSYRPDARTEVVAAADSFDKALARLVTVTRAANQ